MKNTNGERILELADELSKLKDKMMLWRASQAGMNKRLQGLEEQLDETTAQTIEDVKKAFRRLEGMEKRLAQVTKAVNKMKEQQAESSKEDGHVDVSGEPE